MATRAGATGLHRSISTVGLLLLAVHLGGLLVDRFVRFDVLDLFVPLQSVYRPGAVSLGIASLYAMLAVAGSSWIRRRMSTTWWRRLHLLAVPSFALATAHGLAAGADATEPWMYWTYVATSAVVVSLLVLRAATSNARPAVRSRGAALEAARRAGTDVGLEETEPAA